MLVPCKMLVGTMSIGIRSRAMAGVLVIVSLTRGWGHAGSSVH